MQLGLRGEHVHDVLIAGGVEAGGRRGRHGQIGPVGVVAARGRHRQRVPAVDVAVEVAGLAGQPELVVALLAEEGARGVRLGEDRSADLRGCPRAWRRSVREVEGDHRGLTAAERRRGWGAGRDRARPRRRPDPCRRRATGCAPGLSAGRLRGQHVDRARRRCRAASRDRGARVEVVGVHALQRALDRVMAPAGAATASSASSDAASASRALAERSTPRCHRQRTASELVAVHRSWTDDPLRLRAPCAGRAARPGPRAARAGQRRGARLPTAFLWGTAIAGFQTEAGGSPANADTRSDWWVWSHDLREHRPAGHVSGDRVERGPGHWRLYRRDAALARRRLGANAFRLSIEWSRIFPRSTARRAHAAPARPAGRTSPRCATTRAELRAIRRRGMTPVLTLNHFTLPTWLHDPIAVRDAFDGRRPRRPTAAPSSAAAG